MFRLEESHLCSDDDSDIRTVRTNSTPPFFYGPESEGGSLGAYDEESSLESSPTSSMDYQSRTGGYTIYKPPIAYYNVATIALRTGGGGRNTPKPVDTLKTIEEESGMVYHSPSYYKNLRSAAVSQRLLETHIKNMAGPEISITRPSSAIVQGQSPDRPPYFESWAVAAVGDVAEWHDFPQSVFDARVAERRP